MATAFPIAAPPVWATPRTPYRVYAGESLVSRAARMARHAGSARLALQQCASAVTLLERRIDREADLALARKRMDRAATHLANCIADLADLQTALDERYPPSVSLMKARLEVAK